MNNNIARKALANVFFAMLVMGTAGPARADDSCSTANAAGSWGFTLTGTLLLPTGAIPIAAVGILTVDGGGNISGKEARSLGGGFANETLTGTWTVNSDCTATALVKVYESGMLVRTSEISLVFDDNSRALRLVQQSLTVLPGTALPVVLTGDGKKLFQ